MRCPVCLYGKTNKYNDVHCIHPQRLKDKFIGHVKDLLESGPRPKCCPIVIADKKAIANRKKVKS